MFVAAIVGVAMAAGSWNADGADWKAKLLPRKSNQSA